MTGGATTDDDIHSLPDEVVWCFGQRHLLEPLNAEELEYLFCDSCGFQEADATFESCECCGLIFAKTALIDGIITLKDYF